MPTPTHPVTMQPTIYVTVEAAATPTAPSEVTVMIAVTDDRVSLMSIVEELEHRDEPGFLRLLNLPEPAEADQFLNRQALLITGTTTASARSALAGVAAALGAWVSWA